MVHGLVAAIALVGPSASLAQPAGPNQSYAVVRGWPDLPADMVLGQISGVSVDSRNRVFVFNRAEGSWPMAPSKEPKKIASPTILGFDGNTGKLVASWGSGQFLKPHGLRVDASDNIWVTDVSLHQLFKFSSDGRLLLSLGVEGVAGDDASHFGAPTDLAFGRDGSIYVSDGYINSRIVKLDANGKFLLSWGKKGSGPGEFNTPHGIAVDARDRVYVADRENGRIQIFSSDGKLLEIWDLKKLAMTKPWGIASGVDGFIYIVDGGVGYQPGNDLPQSKEQLLKVDFSGNVVARWSRSGIYDGQIYWGHDIAVGKDGAVYVGDVFHGMRVQKFTQSITGKTPM
jgi:peptidylamidoglycolate lyase